MKDRKQELLMQLERLNDAVERGKVAQAHLSGMYSNSGLAHPPKELGEEARKAVNDAELAVREAMNVMSEAVKEVSGERLGVVVELWKELNKESDAS